MQTEVALRRMRSLVSTPPTGGDTVALFSHFYGTSYFDTEAEVEGMADVMARMDPVEDLTKLPSPGYLRIYNAKGAVEGPTHGDGVEILFVLADIYTFSAEARSSRRANVGVGPKMPESGVLKWLRQFNLGREVRSIFIYFYTAPQPHMPCCLPTNTGIHIENGVQSTHI